jgi:putative flavoprotein involved in K+ transport
MSRAEPTQTGALAYQRMTPEHPFLMDRLSIADMFDRYVRELDLNYCGESTIVSADWSDTEERWTITLDRAGETCTVYAKFFVQCTGTGSQVPYVPNLPNRVRDLFSSGAAVR